MEASWRYTTFVETYRDKIRKKIRLSRQPDRALDLRSELEVPYCLLTDRRLVVAYEPYASAGGRGPDYAVTYRANFVFNIEVARTHAERNGAEAGDLPRNEQRIVRILLDKLGQMQPGMANLLIIHSPAWPPGSPDLGSLMQQVKIKADGKDATFYAAGGYPNPAAFYKDFLHLNAILLWAAGTQEWVNKQARPGLPDRVLHLVASLLAGEEPD